MDKSKRYDRQLRLWQSHGQMKLEESALCLLNASALGAEILKNLILPGIGSFTIVDGCTSKSSESLNNFFTLSNQGKSRSEAMLPYLLELNEEVGGIAVNANPSQMIKNEINFFKKFNLIIATGLEEDDLMTLSEFCYCQEIPLVVVKICGFFGYLRVSIPEMCSKFIQT